MDYKKLLDKELDDIISEIRKEVSNSKNTKAVAENADYKVLQSNIDEQFILFDKYFNDALAGKQIGLHKSPMYHINYLIKPVARFVEKVYLRISELTNRDIRIFNSNILGLSNQIRNQLKVLFQTSTCINEKIESVDSNINEIYGKIEAGNNSINGVSERIEAVDSNINEIYGKIEAGNNSINGVSERIEATDSNINKINEQISNLDSIIKKQATTFTEVLNSKEKTIRKLSEEIYAIKAIANWRNNGYTIDKQEKSIEQKTAMDQVFYHTFEEKFRGSQDDIRERLQIYVPIILEHFGSLENRHIIDVGCGRGEFIDVLMANGATEVTGVDLNNIQLEICRQKGLDVVQDDCIRYLQQQTNNSVDIISGIQIIEHLPVDTFLSFLRECQRVLKPSGMVIFETPNPSNIVTAATYFYMDPTHLRPLHKDLTKFFVEHSGFIDVAIIETNPVRYASTLLSPICLDGNQEVWDDNMGLLNNLLYGPQDYAVIGYKK